MEFKSQIATTREQSKQLLQLGLKPETADMVYHYTNSRVKSMEWELQTKPPTLRGKYWTPVEESFPEIGETVIVLSKNGKVTTSQRYIPKDMYGNITGKETWKGSKSFADSIIAWMRIPPFTDAMEDILLNAKPMPPEFSDLFNKYFG